MCPFVKPNAWFTPVGALNGMWLRRYVNVKEVAGFSFIFVWLAHNKDCNQSILYSVCVMLCRRMLYHKNLSTSPSCWNNGVRCSVRRKRQGKPARNNLFRKTAEVDEAARTFCSRFRTMLIGTMILWVIPTWKYTFEIQSIRRDGNPTRLYCYRPII